jgi:hypothetical protein
MSEVCGASRARLVTVIITACAWFLISNHCALAELQPAWQTEASCHQPCCGDQPPAKNKTERISPATTLRYSHCSFTLLVP